ncbi:34176_t:CDS:1, partial [Racocetra persica]
SVTRSEIYKSVSFEEATVSDLLHSAKPRKLPKSVRDFLEKKPSPHNRSTEEEMQSWFNGLMEVSNSAWKGVAAADTHKSPYLGGYMPDISVFSAADVAENAFISKYAYTILEVKKQKCLSGLADEDRGQLLDYLQVLVQQQPLRELFALFVSDGRYFYIMTFDRVNYVFQEQHTTFSRGFEIFFTMISKKSPYIMTVEE